MRVCRESKEQHQREVGGGDTPARSDATYFFPRCGGAHSILSMRIGEAVLAMRDGESYLRRRDGEGKVSVEGTSVVAPSRKKGEELCQCAGIDRRHAISEFQRILCERQP